MATSWMERIRTVVADQWTSNQATVPTPSELAQWQFSRKSNTGNHFREKTAHDARVPGILGSPTCSPQVTLMLTLPVMVLNRVSVTVRVWVPRFRRIVWLAKVWTPASAALKV